MAQTYLQIQRQIEKLQRKAEGLRVVEVKGVVDRIKVAIAHYALTAEQLGLIGGGKAARKVNGKSGPVTRTTAKFGDGRGNVWSGRGPRPRWLREALGAGRTLEEFKVGAQRQGSPAAKAGGKVKRAPARVLYRDGAGNAWGGRGPKPKWLKAALDAGQSLEDLAAK